MGIANLLYFQREVQYLEFRWLMEILTEKMKKSLKNGSELRDFLPL